MNRKPTVTEVERNFAHYIDRVATRGERFQLMRDDQPVAVLGPIPSKLQQ